MIKISEPIINESGPWVLEFGEYERIEMGQISVDECMILDNSSPKLEILKCKLDNIEHSKLNNQFYSLEFPDGKISVWHYDGQGRITKDKSFFSRPFLNK
jgi:hypothetical protein